MIAGPSGVGKGSVAGRVLSLDQRGLELSVSVTTRSPRQTETPGRDYHFVSEAEFRRMAERGELLEWAEVFGHLSGTPGAWVGERRGQGKDVLLEIDVEGARQVKEREPDAVLILLSPPDIEELKRRLRGRATESDEWIEKRLAKATWELSQRDLFDHVVVNDELERAAGQVAAIIASTRSQSEEPSA